MFKFIKEKKLKIVEQIAIVLFLAVIIPMSITALIVNNISQQSVRSQLRDSAVLVTNMISDEITFFDKSIKNNLNQIAFALNYFPSKQAKKTYLDLVEKTLIDCEDLSLVNEFQLEAIAQNNRKGGKATYSLKLPNGEYIAATYNLDNARKNFFRSLKDEQRQIYIINGEGNLLAEYNYTTYEAYKKTISQLPSELKKDEPVVFGKIKNQPLVYLSKYDPNITVVVNTTHKVTKNTINDNRWKIIVSFSLAGLAILFIVGLYTYYLYINIRQLFKGIIAISQGNYERQIRLLTTPFTPHEIVFLAFEFNRMATEIHKSYIQLKKNNVELKELNEFRSNLIDTVSHELRTPLTIIQGHVSRLLRQDIKLDEESRQKGLKSIKEQSEYLNHLIDDLLTIPEIDGMRLKTEVEQVYVPEVLEQAVNLVKSKTKKEIVFNISEDFPFIEADKGRLIQVFVNLLENAYKYAYDNSRIVVESKYDDKMVTIYVKNDCDVIHPEKLDKLFEKFVRLDNDTTRTTRGTGLGLFIVKGLINAMNGEIKLSSNYLSGFCVEITFARSNSKKDIE